jgi:hypothetical protein
VVATVAENAASDSDRKMYGFFTVVAVIPCAWSIVLLLVGILAARHRVADAEEQTPRSRR